MNQHPKKSRTLKMVAAIAIILIVIVAIFGVLTYPRTALAFPVSFTIGATVERRSLDVPFLDDQVQVEVVIKSGSALWSASILNQEQTVWSHSAAQGNQTTYTSGWIQISSGTYNFTFTTLGAGSLSADVTVTSKGGFW